MTPLDAEKTWAQMEDAALSDGAQGDTAFYTGKVSACEFFYRRELPKVAHWLDVVEHCEATCFNMQPECF